MNEEPLTSQSVEALASRLDEFVDFKELLNNFSGNLVEMVDGPVFRGILNLLNKKVLIKLPDETYEDLNEFAMKFGEEDYEGAADSLGTLLSKVVNTPLGDDTEDDIFDAVLVFLAGLIKKQVPEEKTVGIEKLINTIKVNRAAKKLAKLQGDTDK